MRGTLVAAVALWAACAHAPVVVTPGHDGDYALGIPDAATWTALAARAGSETLARVEVVKVLLDRNDGRVYFTQSRRWPIHFDFASEFLPRISDHREFNEREYHDEARRFVLGSITHYLDQDQWTFELAASDTLSLTATATAFERVRSSVYVAGALRYRPVPASHQADLGGARARMPVVTNDELFAGLRYQPLELGDAYGRLRIISTGELPTDLRSTDIVVLSIQPLEIPPVAGIITDELQAPLGHIAVLAHSRGTPNMARRGASSLATVTALAGKPVHLHVGASDFTLTAASPADLARGQPSRRTPPRLQLDLRDGGLPALADIDPDDLATFGAKTTQLARVAGLRGITTPRAFGLSFSAYARFLERRSG